MQGQSSSNGSSPDRSIISRNIIATQGGSSGSRALIPGGSSNTNLNANHDQFDHPMQLMNVGSNIASSSRLINQPENSAFQAFFQQQVMNVGSNNIASSSRFRLEQYSQVQGFIQQHRVSVESANIGPQPNLNGASGGGASPGRSVNAPDSIMLFGTRIPVSHPRLGDNSIGYDENNYQPMPLVAANLNNFVVGSSSSPWPAGSAGSILEALLWEREMLNLAGFPVVAPQIQASLDHCRRQVVRSSVRRILQHIPRNEYEAMAIQNNNLIIDLDDDDEYDEDIDDDIINAIGYPVNVDQLSYEELLALQEHVGNVNTGLTREEIAERLVLRNCGKLKKRQREDDKCCICLDKYENDQELGELDCGHYFHSECISQWLLQKNSCPICKATALADH